MIREAITAEEIRAVAQFMTQFEQATTFVKVDVDHTSKTYESLIRSGAAVFFVMEEDGQMQGGLGAIKSPDLHDGKLIAVETFWFVSPQFRGKGTLLFNAFEKWAIGHGCQKLAMVHLSDSYPGILRKLYKRRGYKLAEEHYIKEVML